MSDIDSEHTAESIGSNSIRSQNKKKHTLGKRERTDMDSSASSFSMTNPSYPVCTSNRARTVDMNSGIIRASKLATAQSLKMHAAIEPVELKRLSMMEFALSIELANIVTSYELSSDLQFRFVDNITRNPSLTQMVAAFKEPALLKWLKSISTADEFENWHTKWLASKQSGGQPILDVGNSVVGRNLRCKITQNFAIDFSYLFYLHAFA